MENDYNKVFDQLDEWRNFPGYQLERRADIFFGIHMKDILQANLDTEIELVIPEFPVRKGGISQHDKFNVDPNSGKNRSFNIDYLCITKAPERKVYFIELKTDIGSRNDKQDWYLEEARSKGVSGLINGLVNIYRATRHKEKYAYLIDQFVQLDWVKKEDGKYISMAPDLVPNVIYIQPTNLTNSLSIITFEQICNYLQNSNSLLTNRFLKSLKEWQ